MKRLIEIQNLEIGYASNQSNSVLVKNINADVGVGEVIAILGLNGCGKTTLLKTIKGELKALSGSIKFDGVPLQNITSLELARGIASVSTHYNNPGQVIVEDLIAFGRYPFTGRLHILQEDDKEQINKAIDRIGIENLRNRFVEELSDGEKQKVMLACAFAQNTPILILDEPTSHLDVRNKVSMMNLIKRFARDEKKTILFTTHDLGLAKNVASRIWLIHDNLLVDSTSEEFIKNKTWKPLLEGLDIEGINWL